MIEGKLSCNMIYQDDDCIAILDKYPIDNGHSLVITKKPYEKLTDMDVDEVSKLFSKIPKQDILKVETENDYWEDIPQELF